MVVHRNVCTWTCLNVKSKTGLVNIEFWSSTLKLNLNGLVDYYLSAAIPYYYKVIRPPTIPAWDLNPGPLSLEVNVLLTELTRPDNSLINKNTKE